MRMYNASLEKYKIQCNSVVFNFYPKKSTNVPDLLVGFVEQQLKHCGVFAIYPHMNQEAINNALRQALISYLNGRLRTRIKNYYLHQDEYKRKGITLMPDKSFSRALRWDKELREMLELQSPLEEELSFEIEKDMIELNESGIEQKILGPKELQTETGFSDDEITNAFMKEMKEKSEADKVEQSEAPTEVKRGRPRKVM